MSHMSETCGQDKSLCSGLSCLACGVLVIRIQITLWLPHCFIIGFVIIWTIMSENITLFHMVLRASRKDLISSSNWKSSVLQKHTTFRIIQTAQCSTCKVVVIFNSFHAEWSLMPHPFLIFSQSDYLIQIVDTNSILTDKQCRSRSVGFWRT